MKAIRKTEYRKYSERGVRELCHAVKDNDLQAINEMAEYFIGLGILDTASVIIPAPGHKGNALYTKTIAEIVCNKTGAKVMDILRCAPHETLYSQKKRGVINTPRFYLSGNLKFQGNYYFLDNVYDTGMTYHSAVKLFGKGLNPLIYAKT